MHPQETWFLIPHKRGGLWWVANKNLLFNTGVQQSTAMFNNLQQCSTIYSNVRHPVCQGGCVWFRDFALVAEERIKLRPGLNVITGESGSGKSVLVSALGHILGGPTSESCIRPPATMAVIEGRVHLSPQGQVTPSVCMYLHIRLAKPDAEHCCRLLKTSVKQQVLASTPTQRYSVSAPSFDIYVRMYVCVVYTPSLRTGNV
jgi:hypothetical protein